MNKYNVTFEVFLADKMKGKKSIIVEAGNKKLAILRAMLEINKLEEFKTRYKKVINAEEVE